MSKNQLNIDQIYQKAASEFTPKAPDAIWSKLEASLAAKRRKRLFWWWFSSLAMILISALSFVFFFSPFSTNLLPHSAPHVEIPMLGADSIIVSSKDNHQSISTHSSVNSGDLPAEIIDNAAIISKNRNVQKMDDNVGTSIKSNLPLHKSRLPLNDSLKNSIYSQTNFDANHTNARDQAADNLPFVADESPVENKEKMFDESTIIVDSTVIQTDILPSINDSTSQSSNIDDSLSFINKPDLPKTHKIHYYLAYQLGFGATGGFYSHPNPTIFTTATSNSLQSVFEASSEWLLGASYKNWMLNLSFRYYDIKSHSEFKLPDYPIKYFEIEHFGVSPIGYYSAENIESIMESMRFAGVDYFRNFNKTRFVMDVQSTNIEFGRFFEFKSWRLVSRAGLNIINIKSHYVQVSDGNSWYELGNLLQIKSKIYGFNLGADFVFQTNTALFLGLKSDFVLSFNQINSNREFSFIPYGFFIGPQLGFRF